MAAPWRNLCRTRTAFSRLFPSATFTCPSQYDLLGRSFSRVQAHRALFTSSVVLENGAKPEQNPFYEKYSEKIKIAKVNVAEGKEDARTFEERMPVDRRVIEQTNRMKSIAREHQTKQSLSSNSQSGKSSQYVNTSLDSVLHMDRVEDLNNQQIELLWKEHHQNKDCISACITSDVYQRIQAKAAQYPMFIFPLPRDDGYEFMFVEFSGDNCLMTSLLQYQTLAEHAPWVLAMRHFTELRQSKDIVLMVGEVDTKQLSVVDAQWLGYQTQMYYASDNPDRENLLKHFNKEPQNFNHMSVIDQLEQEIASGRLANPT